MSCNSGNISEDNIKCMSTGTFRNFFLNTEAGTWQRILPMPCETSSFGAVAATEGANPPPKLRSYWGLLLWKDEKKSRALKEILEFMILSRQVMESIWNSIKIQHSSKRPEAFLVSPYRWFVQMGLAGHSPSPGEQLDHGIHLSVGRWYQAAKVSESFGNHEFCAGTDQKAHQEVAPFEMHNHKLRLARHGWEGTPCHTQNPHGIWPHGSVFDATRTGLFPIWQATQLECSTMIKFAACWLFGFSEQWDLLCIDWFPLSTDHLQEDEMFLHVCWPSFHSWKNTTAVSCCVFFLIWIFLLDPCNQPCPWSLRAPLLQYHVALMSDTGRPKIWVWKVCDSLRLEAQGVSK